MNFPSWINISSSIGMLASKYCWPTSYVVSPSPQATLVFSCLYDDVHPTVLVSLHFQLMILMSQVGSQG